MSAAGAAAVRIDARGLLCPWPALRLARALRIENGPVEIVADDPKAAGELTEVAAAAARGITRLGGDPPVFRIAARSP